MESREQMTCVAFYLSSIAVISEPTMREEIPTDLSSTAILMQIKKASDDHLPCNYVDRKIFFP